MCADILNAQGYKNVVLTAPRGGSDGGKDITFTTDEGKKGLACVTLRDDIDAKFKEDFSKREVSEFDIYVLFCIAYLTASQKVQFAQYCRDRLQAEFIPQDIEALRSLLDSSLQAIREEYLRMPSASVERITELQENDMQFLWRLSGNLCAFPGCSNELITWGNELTLLGKMTHIIDRNQPMSRRALELDRKERDMYENLILLCPYHLTIIKNNPSTWTSAKLREMKRSHEATQLSQRKKGSTYGPKFTTLHYLNVPRILMDFSATNGVSLDGFDLNGVHSFRGLDIQQLADTLILSRNCGVVKTSSILFQREEKDHAKGAKDLHNRV